MGHGRPRLPTASKLRLAGSFLGFGVVLAFFSFMAPAYYLRPLACFPTAACNTSGSDPPGLKIFPREPLYPSEEESCALWEVAFDFDHVVFSERAAPASFPPTLFFSFSDPTPRLSRSKRLVSLPRSPPNLPLVLLISANVVPDKYHIGNYQENNQTNLSSYLN